MRYWVLGTGGKDATAVTAFSPEDAAIQARELIRQGATAITIQDEQRREVCLEDLERMLAARRNAVNP